MRTSIQKLTTSKLPLGLTIAVLSAAVVLVLVHSSYKHRPTVAPSTIEEVGRANGWHQTSDGSGDFYLCKTPHKLEKLLTLPADSNQASRWCGIVHVQHLDQSRTPDIDRSGFWWYSGRTLVRGDPTMIEEIQKSLRERRP